MAASNSNLKSTALNHNGVAYFPPTTVSITLPSTVATATAAPFYSNRVTLPELCGDDSISATRSRWNHE